MWNYILLLLIVIVTSVLWVYNRVEKFQGNMGEETTLPGYNASLQTTNTGPEVWQRHPIQTSVLNDMNFKFKKAYNYELENDAYLKALKKTFAIQHNCLNEQDFGVVEPVNLVVPPSVIDAYQTALTVIGEKLKTSEFLKLPDGLNVPTQIVHDKLISYQRHKTIPSVILNMEAILYREGKYHGKHIGLTVQANKQKGFWEILVLDVWINGVVFEDQIGLFPVQANDQTVKNIDLSSPQFPQPRFSRFDDDVQFYEFCSSTNLDQNKRDACIEVIQNMAPKDKVQVSA